MSDNILLDIKNLNAWYYTDGNPVNIINHIDLTLYRNEIVGLVGESGSGKTITAFSIMHLLPGNLQMNYEVFRLNGKNYKSEKMFHDDDICGNKITMIFQDPLSALNPLLKVKDQMEEVLTTHTDLNREERLQKIIDTLHALDFPEPEKRIYQYPHQLSGGLRQRILIAMAMLTSPDLIIADEPTTALDVTTQSKSLQLMLKIKEELKNTILFISHDLYLLKHISDRIYVMYSGEIVESGLSDLLFESPLHPYTKGLIDSIPIPGVRKKLKPIPGAIPSPENRPTGCVFSDRCEFADAHCKKEKPGLIEKDDRLVRCFYPLT